MDRQTVCQQMEELCHSATRTSQFAIRNSQLANPYADRAFLKKILYILRAK